ATPPAIAPRLRARGEPATTGSALAIRRSSWSRAWTLRIARSSIARFPRSASRTPATTPRTVVPAGSTLRPSIITASVRTPVHPSPGRADFEEIPEVRRTVSDVPAGTVIPGASQDSPGAPLPACDGSESLDRHPHEITHAMPMMPTTSDDQRDVGLPMWTSCRGRISTPRAHGPRPRYLALRHRATPDRSGGTRSFVPLRL